VPVPFEPVSGAPLGTAATAAAAGPARVRPNASPPPAPARRPTASPSATNADALASATPRTRRNPQPGQRWAPRASGREQDGHEKIVWPISPIAIEVGGAIIGSESALLPGDRRRGRRAASTVIRVQPPSQA
jgi:hypothetical protein